MKTTLEQEAKKLYAITHKQHIRINYKGWVKGDPLETAFSRENGSLRIGYRKLAAHVRKVKREAVHEGRMSVGRPL